MTAHPHQAPGTRDSHQGPRTRNQGLLPAGVETRHARPPRAVRAAEESAAGLESVADDLAPAVIANRRHLLNRALEGIKRVGRTGGCHGEGLVVVVAAHLATRHRFLPSESRTRGFTCKAAATSARAVPREYGCDIFRLPFSRQQPGASRWTCGRFA